jgi:hypothetical protein
MTTQNTPSNLPVTQAAPGEDPIPKGFYGLDVIWPITNQRFRALFPITWTGKQPEQTEQSVAA